MKKVLFNSQEVAEMILAGDKLLLAGNENILRSLPSGSWIGGTTQCFMGENGGIVTTEKIHVTKIPDYALATSIKVYGDTNIHQIYNDAPHHGFSVMIIPTSCPTHFTFALNAPNFSDFATRPLIGWIAMGTESGSQATPKVFNGTRNEVIENGAVVMHVDLPSSKVADIKIINIFQQDDGDTITFPNDGFMVNSAFVNGNPVAFSDYLREKNIDIRLLLIADLYGAKINVSFKNIDFDNKITEFYAPVFAGVRYKIARPIDNYPGAFRNNVPEDAGSDVFFACNCILNFQYANLEGRKFANFTGPITFGEIAYQLLNQTLVYLTIENK